MYRYQLCGKLGHLVNKFYHRFKTSFAGINRQSPSEISVNVYESQWTNLDTADMNSRSVVSNSSHVPYVIPSPIHPLMYPQFVQISLPILFQ